MQEFAALMEDFDGYTHQVFNNKPQNIEKLHDAGLVERFAISLKILINN